MFNKELLRCIKNTLGRFIAIAAIAALGVGFYAGLRMTGSDMRLSADSFYDGAKMMDIRVVSTLGMSNADIDALRSIEGVGNVMPAYEVDAMGFVANNQYAFRVHSMSESAVKSSSSDGVRVSCEDDNYLNRLVVVEGRLPEKSGECVISADKVLSGKSSIGDVVELSEGVQNLDECLNTTRYTIVGTVRTPYYACITNIGITSLGSGTIQQFMYIPQDDFASKYPYTEAFITVKDVVPLLSGSDKYKNAVDQIKNKIEDIAQSRAENRTAQLKQEAQDKLDSQRLQADSQLADAARELNEAQSKIVVGQQDLDDAESKYDENLKAFTDSKQLAQQKIEQSKQQLEALYSGGLMTSDQYEGALAEIQLQQVAMQQEFDVGQTQLDDALVKIEQARAMLSSARSTYSLGLEEYNRAKIDADAKINAAQKQIDSIEDCEWYVMDRSKNSGVQQFDSDSVRVDNIASFFPFIFFLVAALVSLTTMTRMIDEERMLIGTYKALGYSRGRITSKYILYAFIASAIGSVIGILILSYVLPCVIEKAYAIIYVVPNGPFPIDIGIAAVSAAVGIAITLVATWAAVFSTLRENPASLMLPCAPKPGKRIFLEHITPIWKHTSFTWKVTFRNLFRYRKRFIMTVIGIAGCCGLLLTGIGLQDSINDIVDIQYTDIVKFNTTVTVKENLSQQSKDDLSLILNNSDYFSKYTWVDNTGVIAKTNDDNNVSVDVVAVSDTSQWGDFLTMRTRVGHDVIDFDKSKVVITEKLATLTNTKVGDTITVYKQDETGNATSASYSLVVGAIMENYVLNSIYVDASTYMDVWNKDLSNTKVFAVAVQDKRMRDSLSEEIRSIDGVKTVSFNDEVINTYKTMLKSVNMIVIVLVISAAALAFIVLYNLTNINITERIREIATLKVLGFTSREVNAYIFRETVLLTLIGSIVGLFFGVFLEGYVVETAEVTQVMFGRVIHGASFIIAFLLTLVFSMLVMLAMRKKLARVDMVESLKSNE